MTVGHLHAARRHKSDEFFTRYEDIAEELRHYNLSNKKIYLPCDDYDESNFVEYFGDLIVNEEFDGKEVVATSYNPHGSGKWFYTCGEGFQVGELCTNGSFQSHECQSYMADCDIVITNPPFSQARRFIEQIRLFQKDYILISPIFMLMYKTNWDDLMNERMHVGSVVSDFIRPDGSIEKAPALWISSIKPNYPKKNLIPDVPYNPTKYPKYDNYDAIEVPRLNMIPQDYPHEMGVPCTIFQCDFSNFDIIGHARSLPKRHGTRASDLKLNGRYVFNRIIIKKKRNGS